MLNFVIVTVCYILLQEEKSTDNAINEDSDPSTLTEKNKENTLKRMLEQPPCLLKQKRPRKLPYWKKPISCFDEDCEKAKDVDEIFGQFVASELRVIQVKN